MPNGEIPTSAVRPLSIADRIGPIFDPVFLKIIPHDKLKEITLIQLRAQTKTLQQEMQTCDEIIKIVENINI
ncbi:MAG: hypothetical protein JSV88_29610 [Candidatus Aminicenantes bacterium]|nr:MAG: hypothetical protein JSV88_29610 [Candidatus Aminicenantes bacterium]